MARVGDDSMQAAIIYQHATTEADARIAASLDWEIRRDEEALLERRAGEDRRYRLGIGSRVTCAIAG
jgi:hypothetical protein